MATETVLYFKRFENMRLSDEKLIRCNKPSLWDLLYATGIRCVSASTARTIRIVRKLKHTLNKVSSLRDFLSSNIRDILLHIINLASLKNRKNNNIIRFTDLHSVQYIFVFPERTPHSTAKKGDRFEQ
jgi:hypothetical protein